MGNGNNPVTPLIGNQPLRPPTETKSPVDDKQAPRREESSPRNPKENSSLLLNRQWQNSQADSRKSDLLARLPEQARDAVAKHLSSPSQQPQSPSGRAQDTSLPSQPDKHASKQTDNSTGRQRSENVNSPLGRLSENVNKSAEQVAKSVETAARQLTRSVENAAHQASNRAHQTSSDSSSQTDAKNIHRQTFENLLTTAKGHANLNEFRDQPKEFWDKVRNMSEVRVVETYIRGNVEPRAVSRYGELLEKLTRQHGGNVERFLTSLSPAERGVFAARYQLDKTFGANKLFVGGGVVLNERGEFSLRTFLSNNGKNSNLPPHVILPLLGGDAHATSKTGNSKTDLILSLLEGNASSAASDLPFPEHAAFFAGQSLFNASSAALLSLSLALYQNINAMLALENAALEMFQPKLPGGEVPVTTFANQTTLESSKMSETAARRNGEILAAGALINGALATIEKYRQAGFEGVGLWTDVESDSNGFRFSAGATGAMMGATIGCVVPLSEKSAGEALGFAASVVVGLSDTGLRTLGANTLVSVITSGVQAFLSVSAAAAGQNSLQGNAAANFLNEARAAENSEIDLRQRLFGNRVQAFLTS